MEHQRLTSLSTKRDLSLGGSKPKKIYKPNLNVVRKKDLPKEVIKLVQEQGKHKRDRQSNRQNFRKEQPKNIQVAGVFSQGFGTLERRQTSGGERFYSADSGSQSTGPKIRKKWDWESTANDKDNYEPLIRKDEASSDEEGEYQPVRLPLHANTESFLKSYRKKSEHFVYNEQLKAGLDIKHNGFNEDNKADLTFKNDVNNPFGPTAFKFYDDDHPCLSLIKLPNSLPGKGFDENDKKVDYNLSHMIEGKIGTIKVRQSGKIEAHIGNMAYLLETVADSSFKEQLVYVPDNLKLSVGQDISTLGNINDKYLMLPCWKDLFERKSNMPQQTLKTAINK